MTRHLFVAGACALALAVAAGAFGAHALRGALAPAELQLWETACRYLVIAAMATLVAALSGAVRPARGWVLAGTSALAGGIVFSTTVGALALGAPRWLGAVTPVGGLALILGLVVLAVTGARRLPRV